MPTEMLSKRIAALEACRLLHQSGELDNNLQPIGKESFHLLFSSEDIVLDESDQFPLAESTDPRPGTNKRRQYYQRKVRRIKIDLINYDAEYYFKKQFNSDCSLFNRLPSNAKYSGVFIRCENGLIVSSA